MKTSTIIGLGVLGLGGWYLWTRSRMPHGTATTDPLGTFPNAGIIAPGAYNPAVAGVYPYAEGFAPYSPGLSQQPVYRQAIGTIPQTTNAGTPFRIPPASGPPSSAIGGASGMVAGAAVPGGISLAAGAATAGIGAGAALLTWGIVEKGWFRGGEEGVKVNPARDEFLSRFADLDPYYDEGNPAGFYGLAWMLNEMGAENGPLANIGRAYGDALFADLTSADSIEEFNAAVAAVSRYIAQYPTRVNDLAAFARANFTQAA